MKKTSKIFGAVALSAALAMGTVAPAFAAPAGVGGDPETYTGKSDAVDPHTDVSLKVKTTQINATLPLKMEVVADIDGGVITCPTASAYQIKNLSTESPLYVTGVTGELKDSWAGSTTNQDLANLGTMPEPSDKNTYRGTVYMELTANSDKVVLVGNTLSNPTINWKIERTTDTANPNALGLQLAGATSKINGMDVETPKELITVKYTVAATPNADVTVDGVVPTA